MLIVQTQIADGSTQEVIHIGSRQNGQLNIYVAGNLGGGTLTMEAKAPDNTFVPVQTLTVGMVSLDLGPLAYRLTLAGATTPSFSAWAEDDSEYTQDLVRAR